MRLAIAAVLSSFVLLSSSFVFAGPSLQPPFVLVNANTGAQVPFTNGVNIDPSQGKLWFVIAKANTSTGSAKFRLDADLDTLDNNRPFTSQPGLPGRGAHALAITPYQHKNAGGAAGTAVTINFTVANIEPTPIPSPTASPSPTSTPLPTPEPTPTPTPTPSPTPTATPTPTPTPSPTPDLTPSPSPSPSADPSPSVTPSATPSPSASPAPDSVINAASCALADVQKAIAAATDGDTVNVPAGAVTWNAQLSVTKNISLISDGTVITNGITGLASRPPIVMLNPPQPSVFFRVSGFTFKGGVATADSTNGEIRITGNCHSFRIDHCVFDHLAGSQLVLTGNLWGVIDHCTFKFTHQHPIAPGHDTWGGKTYGNGSWADDAYWGSERYIFIEDNVFDNDGSPSAIDAFEGARFVVRHNQFHNVGLTCHGTEGQGRGTKQIEEYENVYRFDSPNGAASQIRSGAIISFNNKSSGYSSWHPLQVYRLFQKSPHWGPVDGKNLYDENAPNTSSGYWARGTHTGVANSRDLTDSTQNWSANQWRTSTGVFMVRNITAENAGEVFNGVWALANTATTINTSRVIFESKPALVFNPGDVYEIWKVTHALDQPGRGKSVSISGLGNWPTTQQAMNQAAEPCYAWNNTDIATGKQLKLTGTEPIIIEGRDFFNSAKPNYTPYTYPHPLTVR